MRRIRPKSVLVALLLAIGAAGLAQCGSTAEPPAARAPTGDAAPLPAAPSPPAGDGALRAYLVRSRTGRPTPGTLRVTGPGGFVRWAEAGADGVACVDGLPRWVPLDAEATAPGLVPHPVPGVRIRAYAEESLDVLRLGEEVPLEVHVVDEDDQPVPGAAVEVRTPSGWYREPGSARSLARATTGPDGRAVLRGAPPGQWRLESRARGYARVEDYVELVEGALRAPRRVYLGPSQAVEGRLLDTDSVPVAGVEVFLFSGSYAGVESATTGADGGFRFEELPRESCEFAVRIRSGMLEVLGHVELPAEAPVVLRMLPRGEIRGRVLDAATGLPVEGARVVVDCEGSPGGWIGAAAPALTGPDGSFLVRDVPRGRSASPGSEGCPVTGFSISRPGFLPAWLPRRSEYRPLLPCVVPEGSPPSESNALEVRLEKGVAVLHGVVRTRDGKPVPRAWIQLSSEKSRKDGFWLNAMSDAEGRYRMPPAPAGSAVLDAGAYMLHIERRGDTPFVEPDADRTVVLPESGDIERDIVLVPDGAIEGRMVLADGSPAAGYVPVLLPADQRRSEIAEGPPSAEDGTFRMEELWPGTGLAVAADGPKRRLGVSAAFDLEESATVTGVVVRVVLPASVEMRVVGPDGTPVGDAWIRLDREEREPRPWSSGGGVDPDGAFRAEDMEAGEWVAVATAPGFLASAAERLVLAEGEARRGVVLRLREGRAISGRVLDGHGQPVAGAGVGAFPLPEPILFTGSILIKPGGPGDAEQSTESGPDGVFRITGLDEVPYDVAAWKEGLVGSVASLGSGDGAVDLRVRRPFSISGVVLDPDGAPLEGASVEVRYQGAPGDSTFDGFGFGWLRGVSEDPFDWGNSRSGPDGRFDVDAPEGECRVVAAMQGLAFGEAVVRAPAEDVQVRLRVPLSIAGRVVRPDGSPAAGASVEARSVERGEFEGADTSGEDGSFRVEGLAPGRYALSARNLEANLVPAEPDAVAEAGATEFVIPTREGFRFRASVRLPGGGVPARDEFGIVVEKAAGGRTTLDYGEIDESGELVVAGLGRCTLRIHLLREDELFDLRDPLPGTVFGPFEVPGPDRTITRER